MELLCHLRDFIKMATLIVVLFFRGEYGLIFGRDNPDTAESPDEVTSLCVHVSMCTRLYVYTACQITCA